MSSTAAQSADRDLNEQPEGLSHIQRSSHVVRRDRSAHNFEATLNNNLQTIGKKERGKWQRKNYILQTYFF